MADSVGRAIRGSSGACPAWIRERKRGSGGSSFIYLFLERSTRCRVNRCRRATGMVWTAEMDARVVSADCRRTILPGGLGTGDFPAAFASFALLSRSSGRLTSLVNDRAVLFDSTWHSLILLLGGYTLGVVVGLVSGICIGWFPHARYWGMPVLKIVGPIPATAWIPLAMVLSPSAMFSAIGLIALAVWFPVTMLTASGLSNTRASYLDVARTLGAGRVYLIFHVAIPAAMPSIFIGLFMGLGASFLTLVVAETVGVKSGLGWYVSWAQGWAEYGKVYAALLIMAAFFSTIMTALFKVRDRVLVWQKGVIKW